MDNELTHQQGLPGATASTAENVTGFISRVFLWMGGGLVLSALTAAYVGTNDQLYEQLWLEGGALRWIVLLAPFAIILGLGFGMNRLSYASVVTLYVAFAFLQGLMLSFVFQEYSSASIAQAFGASSVAFVGAGAYGLVTKRDLGRLGMVLCMALFGLIAASIVNLFWASSALYWGVTYGGVIIFTLLTAYDVWWVKKVGEEVADGELKQKLAIWGAIALYLDFVNLMLFFLRIFGGRD
ncbi:MAG: Bax inhibitor-1/YccA family protein [Gaiellales bacterium]